VISFRSPKTRNAVSKTPPSPLSRYDALIAAGALEHDPAQTQAVEALDRLAAQLTRAQRGSFGFNFLRFLRRDDASRAQIRGVYLWGSVGRGKTTLMDLFMEAVPVSRKRRVHFYAFMAETHARLHAARHNGGAKNDDPVARVASDFAREVDLLCFDEFAVSDIADATIVARLFSTLFAKGVVVVATSNVEPGQLYENGRNRDLFLPFIALLQERMDIIRVDARADFRLEKHDGGDVYFVVSSERSRAVANSRLAAVMGAGPHPPREIPVNGRTLEVPQARDRTARFTFAEICGQPLGAGDYLTLANNFDTIVVDDVPQLDFDRRNEAKRFIALVDVLYEAKTRLILCAHAEAKDLYRADQGVEANEFRRTVSRLVEMRSSDYLRIWSARRACVEPEP